MNLKQIGYSAHIINERNGWEVFTPGNWPTDGDTNNVRFLCTHIALIHSEVSEALEAVRKRDRANFNEELADTIIRITSVAHGLGIDLDDEVSKKLDKNSKRGYHHGGKAV